MSDSPPGSAAYTVGYGGRRPDEFARLLTANGVRTVVDVRLRPDRAAMGSFAKARDTEKGIAGLLGRSGIAYVSLPELGNLFRDYEDWAERYEKFLAAAGPLLFDRLADLPGPLCLMCAEKKVTECHRRHLARTGAGARAWAWPRRR